MFQCTPRVTAEVYAQLPEEFCQPAPSYWSRVQSGKADIKSFLEGPSFDREGNLWVTDIPFGRLFRVTKDKKFELAFQYDGEPNGLKFHADGRAFITDHRLGLLAFNPQSTQLEVLLGRAELDGLRGLNDLLFLSDGSLFFTDQGQTGLQDPTGRLFYYDTSGMPHIVLANIPSPNGLVYVPESNTIFLAVTRDNAIWRVPLRPNGQAGRVGKFIQMSGGVGPDGMAMDTEGNIAVCHPGLGAVWLFSPRGEPILRIDSPTGAMTTNCAFGGSDGKTLFITESQTGSILTARCPAAGISL